MDISQTHFELFGLPAQFAIDRAALESAYRQVLTRAHPDRFAASGAAEQRVALQWATRINEAYRTLSDDLARARYLCELRGIELAVETNTAMPAAFLMEQMALRESLEEALAGQDARALDDLERHLLADRDRAVAEVASLLDSRGAMAPAADGQTSPSAAGVERGPVPATGLGDATAQAVRKLMFLDRLEDDIEEAIERIETVDTVDTGASRDAT